MKPNKLAKLYSDVLFECANDISALDEVRDSISMLDDLVRSNVELKSFVQSKRLLREDKLNVVDESVMLPSPSEFSGQFAGTSVES